MRRRSSPYSYLITVLAADHNPPLPEVNHAPA